MSTSKKSLRLRDQKYYYQTVPPIHAFFRIFLKKLIRLIIWVLVDFEINGRENLPKKGPAILIANHMEMMESALILGYTPRQLEFFSAIDFPYDPPILQTIINSYGVIPVFRGRPDKKPLKTALGVLKKNGFVGLFPEGSTWEPGLIKPKSGFAWMSAQSGAQVTPIAFSFLIGSVEKAFTFKRPRVVMTIGKPIAPLVIQDRKNRRQEMDDYTNHCWEIILQQLEPEEYARYTNVENEKFEVDVKVLDNLKNEIEVPTQYQFTYIHSMGLMFFRHKIYQLFKGNYKKPVDALAQIHKRPSPDELKLAATSMLEILDEKNGNPYTISFHLGDREGEEIKESLFEIVELCDWAIINNYEIYINPRRYYYSNIEQKEIIQTVQEDI